MPRTPLPPIYQAHGRSLTADACRPLDQAAARGDVRLAAVVHGHYPGTQLPPRVLPGLRSCGFWDATTDQSWGLDWHRNEGIEITYLERGQITFGVDHRDTDADPAVTETTLRRGAMTVTRPWQAHRVGSPHIEPSRLHWVILDVGVRRPDQPWRWPRWVALAPGDLARLEDRLRHDERPVAAAGADVGRCFRHLAAAHDRPGEPDVSRLSLHLNELLVLVLETLDRRGAPRDRTLSSTRRAVDLFLRDLPNHPDRDWSLAAMAEACGLGTSQFSHYCREVTGLSPHQYHVRCRLDAARALLARDPSRSVTDVALACGFGSSQHFANAFRRATGTSPTQFRDRHHSPTALVDGSCLRTSTSP